MKIITKFINQGSVSVENSELLKDLENSTLYPYINFKDSINGIHVGVNKTIDAVRKVSFERDGDFKQKSTTPLQMRVGSVDQILNVVGLLIPSSYNSPYCIKNGKVQIIGERKRASSKHSGYKRCLSCCSIHLGIQVPTPETHCKR
jgi:hypothetical protein